ncbi:MAG: NfeD family protein [Actinomycetota bacterium]|nr:NfeD family protein [Actinomycetota bacterium]
MLEENSWLVWLGVALALGAIEAATVDLVFIMLAGGALGGAAAAGFGAPFPLQVVLSVVTAGLLLGVVRPVAKKHLISPTRSLMGTASYAGREATVVEETTESSGRVRIGGETWTARVVDPGVLLPGERVTVLRIDGATAIVGPAPPPVPGLDPGPTPQDSPVPPTGG